MLLVQKHIIKRNDSRYTAIDEAAYKSKNLYNSTLYAVRQHYFEHKKYIPYAKLQHDFQENKQFDYCNLPAKVAQWTMKMVEHNFKAYFSALKEYRQHPEKFEACPKIPKYLDSEFGRYLLTYTSQAISKKELDKRGVIKPSGLDIEIHTKLSYSEIRQVRIVRGIDSYTVEILYKVEEPELMKDNGRYAAIDLGIDNFATFTTNNIGDVPFAISGKGIKSINHWYNKQHALYKSVLEKRNGKKHSGRLKQMAMKRKNRLNDFMHKSSRYIVNHLVSNGITALVIGKNNGWKQDINIGKANNQNFVQIPYENFIDMLKYKCRLQGIRVITVDESYTSKCSFLDGEDICKHGVYAGRRIKRGLFRSREGTLINADVNGSYNILRKCKPKAFANGVTGVVVHPVIIRITNGFQ